MKKFIIILAMLLSITTTNAGKIDLCDQQMKAYEDLILEYQSALDSIECAVKDGNMEEVEDALYRHRDDIDIKLNRLIKIKEKKND